MVFVRKTETKMGTYTTNYQLYMPTIGETGWGELVNGNYQTIDSTMKSLSNRVTAVENEVNGALNCTSVTTSGKITGNGGIAGTTGTFSGAVTAASLTSPIVLSPYATSRFKLVISESVSVLPEVYRFGNSSNIDSIKIFDIRFYNSPSGTTYTFNGNLGLVGDGAWYNITSVEGSGYGTIKIEPNNGANITIKTPNATYTFTAETSRTMSISELNDIFGNICIVTVTKTDSTKTSSGSFCLYTTTSKYASIVYA